MDVSVAPAGSTPPNNLSKQPAPSKRVRHTSRRINTADCCFSPAALPDRSSASTSVSATKRRRDGGESRRPRETCGEAFHAVQEGGFFRGQTRRAQGTGGDFVTKLIPRSESRPHLGRRRHAAAPRRKQTAEAVSPVTPRSFPNPPRKHRCLVYHRPGRRGSVGGGGGAKISRTAEEV